MKTSKPKQNEVFKFEQLFGSKTRSRLLGLFLLNPETAFFVRELTRKIDAQLNSVRRELKNLMEIGLVLEVDGGDAKKGSGTLSDKKKYYQVNRRSILFENLRSLFQKVHILLKQNLVQEISEKGTVDYLAFTGKFVSSTSKSPTDMVVIGAIPEKQLQALVHEFEQELGREVNYTLMTKTEYLYRKDVKDRFLLSVLEGEQIVLINEIGL